MLWQQGVRAYVSNRFQTPNRNCSIQPMPQQRTLHTSTTSGVRKPMSCRAPSRAATNSFDSEPDAVFKHRACSSACAVEKWDTTAAADGLTAAVYCLLCHLRRVQQTQPRALKRLITYFCSLYNSPDAPL